MPWRYDIASDDVSGQRSNPLDQAERPATALDLPQYDRPAPDRTCTRAKNEITLLQCRTHARTADLDNE